MCCCLRLDPIVGRVKTDDSIVISGYNRPLRLGIQGLRLRFLLGTGLIEYPGRSRPALKSIIDLQRFHFREGRCCCIYNRSQPPSRCNRPLCLINIIWGRQHINTWFQRRWWWSKRVRLDTWTGYSYPGGWYGKNYG